MEAVVLAGGQGTRLLPLTSDLPKALAPVGGRPVIEILLQRFRQFGVTKVHLAVNHLADQIETALGDGSKFGLEICYSHEPEPLSTVGPITLVENLPERFIVANADILTDLDLAMLAEEHERSGCKLTVATCLRTDKMEYGVFEITGDGRVAAFTEKPSYQFRVSMGVYIFSKAVLKYVPPRTRFGFDDLITTLLAKYEPIHTVLHKGFWLDIGRVQDYLRANSDDADQIARLTAPR